MRGILVVDGYVVEHCARPMKKAEPLDMVGTVEGAKRVMSDGRAVISRL